MDSPDPTCGRITLVQKVGPVNLVMDLIVGLIVSRIRSVSTDYFLSQDCHGFIDPNPEPEIDDRPRKAGS
jgi:hypothetical protein